MNAVVYASMFAIAEEQVELAYDPVGYIGAQVFGALSGLQREARENLDEPNWRTLEISTHRDRASQAVGFRFQVDGSS